MYLCDTYTIPSNLSGDPGMSVPFGTGDGGLPVGVQVLAPALNDAMMFALRASSNDVPRQREPIHDQTICAAPAPTNSQRSTRSRTQQMTEVDR